jgi:hypothetical protein
VIYLLSGKCVVAEVVLGVKELVLRMRKVGSDSFVD